MQLDDLRHRIYETFAETGRAPSESDLQQWCGGTPVVAALQRLHDDHAIVLDGGGTIRMALPFSAIDVGYQVRAGDRSWWANCAWDTYAIPAALGIDASVEATWLDGGGPVDLQIVDGRPSHADGYVHFAVPARRWWDDIVET